MLTMHLQWGGGVVPSLVFWRLYGRLLRVTEAGQA